MKGKRMKEIILRAEVANKKQLEQAVQNFDLQYIYAPLDLLDESTPDKYRIIAVPPLFLGDCEEKVQERLIRLKAQGFDRALAHTAGHISLIQAAGLKVHGGFRLNITNSVSQNFYEENGLENATLSFELTVDEAEKISHKIPVGLIAYGKLPLMVTRRCPIKNGPPCNNGKSCGKTITDRKGNSLSVICSNTVEVLNPDTLILSDKIRDFISFDFLILKFTVEDDVDKVVEMYLNSGKPNGNITRGLYYRGVE